MDLENLENELLELDLNGEIGKYSSSLWEGLLRTDMGESNLGKYSKDDFDVKDISSEIGSIFERLLKKADTFYDEKISYSVGFENFSGKYFVELSSADKSLSNADAHNYFNERIFSDEKVSKEINDFFVGNGVYLRNLEA